MSEEEARVWITDRFGVPRGTSLAAFANILRTEAAHQNLVSAGSLGHVWTRHLLDSAQLVPLAQGASDGSWIDVGSGAGLPGMVVAILTDREVVLVEPRAKRAAFLHDTVVHLGLSSRVSVQATKVENYRPSAPAAVISARAVSALPPLLSSTIHCSDCSTVWLLPKGRNADSEVATARTKWQGTFHVEPSITQPESGIVVAQGVRPK